MIISLGLGGNGGNFSTMTDRGGGGSGGRVLVTTFSTKKTRLFSLKFNSIFNTNGLQHQESVEVVHEELMVMVNELVQDVDE